jgi:hypothetical protein
MAARTIPLRSHPKQWALLTAFAQEHPASHVSLPVVDRALNDQPKRPHAWGAIKGLAHSINQTIRDALDDQNLISISRGAANSTEPLVEQLARELDDRDRAGLA